MVASVNQLLLVSLLDPEVYEEVKYKLAPNLFPDKLGSLFRTLQYSHSKHNVYVTLDELLALHTSINPTLTNATANAFADLVTSLKSIPIPSTSIIHDIIKGAWRQEKCREVMEKLSDAADGVEIDWDTLTDTIHNIKEDSVDVLPVEEVTLNDVMELVGDDEAIRSNVWKFNIPQLDNATRGLPKTSFGIIGAPPETGKTAFYISLICGPNGFLHQGANVHIWRNEENVNLIATRIVCSLLNIEASEIPLYHEQYREMVESVTGKLHLLKDETTAGKDISDIETYLRTSKSKVDILVIDQIDNITYNGRDAQDDVQLLGKLYAAVRRLANQYGCAIIALTQAGDKAKGKLYYGYESLYASKTNKAATGDYILCLGAQTPEPGGLDTGLRAINFAKNKMGGPQKPIMCWLKHSVSRIESAPNITPPPERNSNDD